MKAPLSQGASNWLDDHLDTVKAKILDEASRLAELDSQEPGIEPRHIAEAAKRFAPGIAIPSEEPGHRLSIIRSIFSWTPSITTVSAILTIAFGVIGWKASSPSAFDIAKVFAGAIVGSAGVAAGQLSKRD